MKKEAMIIGGLTLVLCIWAVIDTIYYSDEIVSAEQLPNPIMTIDYFYSPTCGHCSKVTPLVNSLRKEYYYYDWNVHDVSLRNYNIPGVPRIEITTDDGREIVLSGSLEIPKYLKCELQQQSTKECPTHSNLVRGSYFLEK